MSSKRYWSEVRVDEFASGVWSDAVAIAPLGAIEQHGPHLPMGVDTMIVDAVVERAVALMDNYSALVMPTMTIGKSNEHINFPGTLTLSAQTVLNMWKDIGACVARAGLKKLLFVNAHGGNTSLMDIIARDLRAEHGLITVSCSWWSLAQCEDLFDQHELIHGVHGGQGETSILLAIAKHLVEMKHARNFSSAASKWAEEGLTIGAGSTAAKLGWLIEDLNPDGACGDATGASAEMGEAMLDRGAKALAEFVSELRDFSV